MPIELRTGLPGAGKSLFAVARLMELAKKYPDRPRFALGITDLRPDLATIITLEQFQNWDQFPKGSIIVVDECQQYMPSRRSGDPPAWISKLSTHRHLGLDFIFITQHPTLIDTYVRRLVNPHIHVLRLYGTKMAEFREFAEVCMDPAARSSKGAALNRSRHPYPKDAMQAYTSSELHTVQARLPRFVKVNNSD